MKKKVLMVASYEFLQQHLVTNVKICKAIDESGIMKNHVIIYGSKCCIQYKTMFPFLNRKSNIKGFMVDDLKTKYSY